MEVTYLIRTTINNIHNIHILIGFANHFLYSVILYNYTNAQKNRVIKFRTLNLIKVYVKYAQ